MSQTSRVLGVATVIGYENGLNYVQYHATKVVQWNASKIILNSNGWHTATTKLRMNQASRQFDLDFVVSQRDFEWSVTTPNGDVVPFVDKIELSRE